MGLLDKLWGDLRNAAGQEEGQLPQMLLSSLGGGENQASQANGLRALIERFQSAGLGNIVASWISNDQQNQPVAPDQVHKALGDEHISALAQKTGLPKDALVGALAALLPKLIDSLTPNGQIPNAPDTKPLENTVGGPDQSPGEAEAPPSTETSAAQRAVGRTDPTEPTQAER
jgi:uncharacterized protein YidB (DUF937 family)